MKQEICSDKSFKVVGLTTRTNNANEMNPETWKIMPLIQKFYQGQAFNKIIGRTNPGVLICCYMEYESDYTGEYTYFVGEKVEDSTTKAPEGLTLVTVPEQKYVKFTNGPDAMPKVVQDAWQNIWKINNAELGGKRTYQVDWEIYDERARDQSAATIDIFIGIN